MNVTKHRDPPKVSTFDGPQTSECKTIKGTEILFILKGNETRRLFVTSKTLHLKLET